MSIANFTFLNKSLPKSLQNKSLSKKQKSMLSHVSGGVPPRPHLNTLIYAHAHFGHFFGKEVMNNEQHSTIKEA
jgi:hypothetical protein